MIYCIVGEWWELVVAIRKISIVAIGTFGTLMPVVDLQAFVALGIVFISIILHLIGEPYDKSKRNSLLLHNLEFSALTIGWCTFWSGLLFFLGHTESGSVDSWVKEATTVIIVGTNCIFMMIALYIFVREYLRDRRHAVIRRTTMKKKEFGVKMLALAQSGGMDIDSDLVGTNSSDEAPLPLPTSVQVVPTNNHSQSEHTVDISSSLSSTSPLTAMEQMEKQMEKEIEARILLKYQNMHIQDKNISHDSHAESVINEFHGHEQALQILNRKRSKKAKRQTQLRLLSRSKLKSSKALQKVIGFSHLKDEMISHIVDNMKLIKYQPNEIICKEGADANTFYVIISGNCRVTSLRHGKRRMATIGEFDFFGESAFSSDTSRRVREATVTVISEEEESKELQQKGRHGVQVLALERAEYERLCSTNDVDLSSTHSSIERVAWKRHEENRQNLVASRAMTRIQSMRNSMVKKGKEEKKTEDTEGKEEGKEEDDLIDNIAVDEDEWDDGLITTKGSMGLKLAASFVRSNPEFITSTSSPSTTAATDDFSIPTKVE